MASLSALGKKESSPNEVAEPRVREHWFKIGQALYSGHFYTQLSAAEFSLYSLPALEDRRSSERELLIKNPFYF